MMKKISKKEKNKKLGDRGITLIALIVTIIVLLILAGVSISVLTGENGIINRTTEAKKTTEEAEAQEKLQLELEALKIDYYKSGRNGTFAQYVADHISDLQTALGDSSLKVKNGKITTGGYEYTIDGQGNITAKAAVQPAEPVEVTTKNTTTYGNWTILNNVPTEGGYDEEKGQNMPKLGEKLKAVVLTDDLPIEARVDNSTASLEDITWYNYVAQTGSTDGTSKWANAVTLDSNGDITGFYVWIPRFAYKITNGYHGNGLTYDSNNVTTESGTIEIRFLKDNTNKFMEGNTEVTAKTSITDADYDANGVQTEWLVHPAFTSNAAAGGGFGELTGIWVAKFEMSAFIGESSTATRDIGAISGNTVINLCSIPGVQSAHSLTIGEMYQLSLEMDEKMYENTTNVLDSHLMKNSEWGAAAYLAHSKYGRNGTEVSSDGGVWYTGGATTADGYLNKGEQSTTGNAYGIYDMAGVSWEYVASYVNNGNNTLTSNGGNMTSSDIGVSSKYKTVYAMGTSDTDQNNYNANSGIKGDAIYETSRSYSGSTSWNSDYSYFPDSYGPFFEHGGASNDGTGAGLFCFNSYGGYSYDYYSFRVCLAF